MSRAFRERSIHSRVFRGWSIRERSIRDRLLRISFFPVFFLRKIQRAFREDEENPRNSFSAGSCPASGRKFAKRIDKMGNWRYNADKFSVKLQGIENARMILKEV